MASASSGVAGLGLEREREERKRRTEGVELVVGIAVGDKCGGSDRRSSKGRAGGELVVGWWLFGSDPNSAGSFFLFFFLLFFWIGWWCGQGRTQTQIQIQTHDKTGCNTQRHVVLFVSPPSLSAPPHLPTPPSPYPFPRKHLTSPEKQNQRPFGGGVDGGGGCLLVSPLLL